MTENVPPSRSSSMSRPVRAVVSVAEGIALCGVLGFALSLVSGAFPPLVAWVSLSALTGVFVCSLALAAWTGFSASGARAAASTSNGGTWAVAPRWRWAFSVGVPLTVLLVGVVEFLWGWGFWVRDTELPFLWLSLVLVGSSISWVVRSVRSLWGQDRR